MRVLVVGGGRTGSYLAEKLVSKGHQVVLIEKSAAKSQELTRRFGAIGRIEVVQGDGNDPGVLREAGASDSDALAAATGDDEDNLVIGLLAKREFGIRRVVGRVNNPRNDWLYSSAFGFDAAVRPAEIIADLIEEEIEQPAP
ncbi:MAG: potassium channel family protein [Chloroflexota bacterium]